eukprot:3933020-Rhodomonas_salina.1
MPGLRVGGWGLFRTEPTCCAWRVRMKEIAGRYRRRKWREGGTRERESKPNYLHRALHPEP